MLRKIISIVARFVIKLFLILLMAFMLGISNVINQENRMINNSADKIEQEEIQDNQSSL